MGLIIKLAELERRLCLNLQQPQATREKKKRQEQGQEQGAQPKWLSPLDDPNRQTNID